MPDTHSRGRRNTLVQVVDHEELSPPPRVPRSGHDVPWKMEMNSEQALRVHPRKTPPKRGFSRVCPALGGLGFLRGGRLESEPDLVVVADVDQHLAAVHEPTEQQLVGKCLSNRVLDEP